MVKRLRVAFALALFLSVLVPAGAHGAIGSQGAAGTSVGSLSPTKLADSGESAASELPADVHAASGGSLVGRFVSDPEVASSGRVWSAAGSVALIEGEQGQGMVSSEVKEVSGGFIGFLAEPTLMGLNMGALIWIFVAVSALAMGLLALVRTRNQAGMGSLPNSSPLPE